MEFPHSSTILLHFFYVRNEGQVYAISKELVNSNLSKPISVIQLYLVLIINTFHGLLTL